MKSYCCNSKAGYKMSSTIHKMAPYLIGIVLGFCLTSIFKIGSFEDLSRNFYQCESTSPPSITTVNETVDRNLSSKPLPQESTAPPDTEITEIKINSSVASRLEKEVRIVCWIMTRPVNATEKILAVKKTWGRRCTKLLILSSANNTETGTMGLNNTQEGRDWLWAKTKEAFKYIYANHLEDGEWFLKADDDTPHWTGGFNDGKMFGEEPGYGMLL
ncbi:unnamed protein product [Allacma fusca]|uniref:Hexosyltransferase n=1 Tax=Allacma fusca TaxID=39272 RepID=A0A8J2NQU3_9HEXA|nr:unnamed protein product [Allacma fusca]